MPTHVCSFSDVLWWGVLDYRAPIEAFCLQQPAHPFFFPASAGTKHHQASRSLSSLFVLYVDLRILCLLYPRRRESFVDLMPGSHKSAELFAAVT